MVAILKEKKDIVLPQEPYVCIYTDLPTGSVFLDGGSHWKVGESYKLKYNGGLRQECALKEGKSIPSTLHHDRRTAVKLLDYACLESESAHYSSWDGGYSASSYRDRYAFKFGLIQPSGMISLESLLEYQEQDRTSTSIYAEFRSSRSDLVKGRPWKNGLTIEITEDETSAGGKILLKAGSFLFLPPYSREELSSELIVFIHYERSQCFGTPPKRFG